MQKSVRNRLLLSCLTIALIAGGVALMLRSMSDNIVFFYEPSELHKADLSKDIRLGGLVEKGSIVKIDAATLEFYLTDYKTKIRARYRGVIPTLFREGQGVVAAGMMHDDLFVAKELLTKHDENYKPPAPAEPPQEDSKSYPKPS